MVIDFLKKGKHRLLSNPSLFGKLQTKEKQVTRNGKFTQNGVSDIMTFGKSLDDLSHDSSRLMYKRPNFVF